MTHTDNNPSFLVYKSSAGSGKTYNLARAYLHICFSHFESNPLTYRNILAITFTNKAVNEMKSRILLFLEELANGSNATLMEDFKKDFTEEKIRQNAAMLLKYIHHDYSNFSIFTIDSFFQQILRAFAYDLNLPSNHQIELNSDIIIKHAVDMVLSKLGRDDELTELIVNYSQSKVEDSKHWRIDSDLQHIAKTIYRDEALPALKKIESLEIEEFKSIVEQLNKRINIWNSEIKSIGNKAVATIYENDLLPDSFFYKKRGIGTWFEKVAENGMGQKPNSYVEKTVNEDVWLSKGSEQDIVNKIDKVKPDLLKFYNEIITYSDKFHSIYTLYCEIRKQIYPIALLNEIKKAITQIKTDDKTLHISETNHAISQVVQHEYIPFIYERLGSKYKYFFIDEFQDTSILQWLNILPLFTEGLSTEVSRGKTGKAIIFGDAKQAIYRFREGDVRQFNRLPKVEGDGSSILREREKTLEANYQPKHLNKNYRSKQEVVTFNNDFFRYLLSSKSEDSYCSEMYKDLEQTWKDNNEGGGVQLHVLQDTQAKKSDVYTFVFQEILEIITAVKKEGYQFSDIAILCRKNDMASFLAHEISQKGIDVLSSESLLLNQSIEVQFIISCFQYMLNRNDELARMFILQYVLRRKNKDFEPYLIKIKTEQDFLSVLREFEYNLNPSKLVYLTNYEMFEELLLVFDLKKLDDPYLFALAGVIFEYDLSATYTYANFIEYWEERGSKISLSNPEGIDAVNILTIHKSKGLQFPIVIYPQYEPKRSGKTPTKWVDLDTNEYPIETAFISITSALADTEFAPLYEEEKRLEELDDLNVNYVACTRAKDRLYLLLKTVKDTTLEEKFFISKNIENTSEDPTKAIYAYGKFSPYTKKEELIPENESVKNANRVRLASPPLVLKRDYESKEMQWGKWIHTYLSFVYTPQDIDLALDKIKTETNFSDKDREIARRIFTQLTHSDLKPILFGEADAVVKTEIEIMSKDAKLFRIDRLVLQKDSNIVIDFKTGVAQASYHKQVMKYADLMKEINNKHTKSYIVYISEDGNLSLEKVYETT